MPAAAVSEPVARPHLFKQVLLLSFMSSAGPLSIWQTIGKPCKLRLVLGQGNYEKSRQQTSLSMQPSISQPSCRSPGTAPASYSCDCHRRRGDDTARQQSKECSRGSEWFPRWPPCSLPSLHFLLQSRPSLQASATLSELALRTVKDWQQLMSLRQLRVVLRTYMVQTQVVYHRSKLHTRLTSYCWAASGCAQLAAWCTK